MAVQFTATEQEFLMILSIEERARTLRGKYDLPHDMQTTIMDIEAAHSNGCPLNLAALLSADDFNFMHDVAGISRHIDRTTGKLGGCFLPRFYDRSKQ